MPLPVEALRSDLKAHLKLGPVVVTAPTGTGKSTEVPRWLLGPDTGNLKRGGFILVIQPRRVAARAVAARIADVEGAELGRDIGYRVRDDDLSSSETRLLVVTPGIVLSRPDLLETAATVVLDELHERRLDTDLILALLDSKKAKFIAMSATLDGEFVAQAVNGTHLSVEARTYPVGISYLDEGGDLPDARNLERNVRRALAQLRETDGDILIFLPGRGEITRVCESLQSEPFEIVPLHGSLSLKDQARALQQSAKNRRRVIVSTNVAETSLTIPSVRAVIDSGLVRRTSYHNGRSYLTLSNVALDSADQRAGRAGRTAPGQCIRLWGRRARLEPSTPPEIHRESLTPLIMTCAAMGIPIDTLSFLDAPHAFALSDARERLKGLGALAAGNSPDGDRLTDIGVSLQGLPLDAWLSRLLIEAKSRDCLDDATCLVAGLEQINSSQLARTPDDTELDHPNCDAEAIVRVARAAFHRPDPRDRELGLALKRLRRALKLSAPPALADAPFDRERLLLCLLRADPKSAHIARVRKQRVSFSNGGTELELGRESRANRLLQGGDEDRNQLGALLAWESRGISHSSQARKLIVTIASPVSLQWLARNEVGSLEVKRSYIEKKGPNRGQLVALAQRIYAGRVLAETEVNPEGPLARTAIVKLFVEGSLHRKASAEAKRRLERRALAASLGTKSNYPFFAGCEPPPSLELWLTEHLATLGVENGADLQLLEASDFLPDDVDASLLPQLSDHFPLEVDVGDCRYKVEYDLGAKQVNLTIIKGHRKSPPPANYLPRFEGFRVYVEAGGSFHALRR